MNIKSKDFLERVEISEERGTSFALMGLILGAISIFIAVGKDFSFLAITYGILIIGKSIYSLLVTIKERRFYLKVEDYKRIKGKIRINFGTDIILIIFGIILILSPFFRIF